jgi:hypothetical protein
MNYIWDSVYEHRWKWAKIAEAEFKQNLQKLNVDDYTLKNDTNEITIGVYGPTQVGKTTLILRLLGVRQEAIETVSDWLRGKRKQGHSATVTATEYKQSDNDLFHFYSKESGWKRHLTGEQLEKVLFDVRSQVEEQGEISTDRMIIEIANSFFEDSLSISNLNFIDLPGIQSAEKKEQLQVQNCVRHWLPICELTLLVDDATLINEYALIKDKNVKDWMHERDRFRIIPTHALTLESLLLDLQDSIDKEKVRNYYASELSRSLNGTVDAQDLAQILYPIDIGRTLQTMKMTDAKLYNSVYPMMEDILQELREDLCSQKPEALHFKHLASIYSKAEKQKQEELAQLDKRLQKLDRNIEKQTNFMRRLHNKQQHILEDKKGATHELVVVLEKVQSVFSTIKKFNWKSDLEERFERIKSSKSVSSINGEASAFQLKWESEVEQKINSLKKIMDGIPCTRDIRTPSVNERIYYVDKMFDFYVFLSNYEIDLAYVKRTTKNWVEAYMLKFVLLVEGIVEDLNKEINQREKQVDLQVKKHQRDFSLEEGKLRKFQKSKTDMQQERNQIEFEWQQDLEHCQELEYYFQKNAVLYFQSLKSMLRHGSTTAKWEAQHLLFLLERDSEMVIRYLKGKDKAANENSR